MEIEFDAEKDASNQRKQGWSLADAVRLDWDLAAVISDDRRAYGESRFRAYAPLDGRMHILVFAMRGEVLRPISLRKANPREVKRYGR